jgi:hypothetical protein
LCPETGKLHICVYTTLLILLLILSGLSFQPYQPHSLSYTGTTYLLPVRDKNLHERLLLRIPKP